MNRRRAVRILRREVLHHRLRRVPDVLRRTLEMTGTSRLRSLGRRRAAVGTRRRTARTGTRSTELALYRRLTSLHLVLKLLLLEDVHLAVLGARRTAMSGSAGSRRMG